jgi:hypothetical protein
LDDKGSADAEMDKLGCRPCGTVHCKIKGARYFHPCIASYIEDTQSNAFHFSGHTSEKTVTKKENKLVLEK